VGLPGCRSLVVEIIATAVAAADQCDCILLVLWEMQHTAVAAAAGLLLLLLL
jgi:hypothetical protein